jgi:hypothetical protein
MDKQYDIAYDYFFFLCILSPFIFICCWAENFVRIWLCAFADAGYISIF